MPHIDGNTYIDVVCVPYVNICSGYVQCTAGIIVIYLLIHKGQDQE